MVSERWGDIYGRVDTTEATGRTSWRNDSVVVKDHFIENHLRVVKRNSPYVEYKGYCCRHCTINSLHVKFVSMIGVIN
jgi:hypothetical protein